MIVIVNYGVGNSQAFANVYKRLNIPCSIASNANDLEEASKIILPGVGAFDHAMEQLDKSGMRPALDELVLEREIPVLGVCVGMQMMGYSSEEGDRAGLGWIGGTVKKIDTSVLTKATHLPHMGWNDVILSNTSPLFNKLENNAVFYFLHSFYFVCTNEENVIASAKYGQTFACGVNSENVFGIQFHAEKSHACGIQLLDNFANL